MPAVAHLAERDQRGEAGPQAVGAGRRVHGLPGQQLPVGRGDRVGGGDVELELPGAVLAVELADGDAVAVEVAQQLLGEGVHGQHLGRAVGGAVVDGTHVAVAFVARPAEVELHLVARQEVEPERRGPGDLPFQDASLVVRPRGAVGRHLPPRHPREPGLPGEPDEPVGDGHQPDVARGGAQRGVLEGDAVVGVEDREQRRDPDPALDGGAVLAGRHRTGAGDAVVVGPHDRDPGHPGGGQVLSVRFRQFCPGTHHVQHRHSPPRSAR